MKVQVEPPQKSQIKLIIELEEDDLMRFREKAAESLSKRVKIPGYREGKAPTFVVETQVGKEDFLQEVLRHALPVTYTKAVSDHKVLVISRPKITVVSEFPLKYEALVAVMPEISIKGYDKVKIKQKDEPISEQELENVLSEMQRYHATYAEKKDAVQKGDRVEIDFEGFDEQGNPVENTKSQNHPLFVGEGTLVTGFEDELIGMSTGEKKSFSVELHGKKVKFEVEMKKAESVTLPIIDEAFVEKIAGQKKSVPEFQAQVKEDLTHQKARDMRRNQENDLLETWLKLGKMDLPETLLEEETEYLIEELGHDLKNRQLKIEQYEQYMTSKGRDLRKEKREEAEKRLRIRLILQKIFELEKIQISENEILNEIETLLMRVPEDERRASREMIQKDRNRRLQIENALKLDKLFEKFLGIKEVI